MQTQQFIILALNTCTARACLHDCVYTARLWRNVGILSCLLDADAMFAEEKVVKSTGTSRSVKEIDSIGSSEAF